MDSNAVTGRLVRTLHACDVDMHTALDAVLDLAACVLIAEGVDPQDFAEALVRRVSVIRSVVMSRSGDAVARSVAAGFDEA